MDEQTHPDPNEADAARKVAQSRFRAQLLDEMLQLGADLKTLLVQVTAEQTAAFADPDIEGPIPDLTVPYDRLSGTIRRNILLAERLANPRQAPEKAPEPKAPTPSAPNPPAAGIDAAPTQRPIRLDPTDRLDTIETIDDELNDEEETALEADADPDDGVDGKPQHPGENTALRGLAADYAAICQSIGIAPAQRSKVGALPEILSRLRQSTQAAIRPRQGRPQANPPPPDTGDPP